MIPCGHVSNVTHLILYCLLKTVKVFLWDNKTNKMIESVDSMKFLGLEFDQRLTFNTHINNIINKIYIGKKILSNTCMGPFKKLNTKTRRNICLTIVRSIMEYGAPSLTTLSKYNIHKLEVNQNKCLRLVNNKDKTTSIENLLKLTSIDSFQNRILEISKKWYLKVNSVENHIIHNHQPIYNLNDKYPTPFSIINN